jgi:putative transposase
MSRKRTIYNASFKAKVVLELLEGDETLNKIASKYDLLPKNLQNWKKQFLQNASLAFDKSTVTKEYKEEIEKLKKEKDATSKKLGEVIVERDFVVEKLKSLVSSKNRVKAVDTKLNISLNKQLKLLSISKTIHYYKPIEKFSSNEELKLLNIIAKIHTKYPYYGTRRVEKLLKRLGFNVGRKLIKSAFEFMGIRALYPKVKTTILNKKHKKYPYLLDEFKNDNNQVIIDTANKVWSADITYIKLEKGFAYLAAIIDWHTKKILSWKLSNSIDAHLTTSVLNDALSKYPSERSDNPARRRTKPEIFNTDQGSRPSEATTPQDEVRGQYTAKEHIDILIANNIAISMDAKGRSIDNIVMERFWRSIKYEDIYPNSYQTIKEARDGIKEYIEIYNKERLHSSIDYLTPDEVYYKGINNKYYNAKDVLRKVA